MEKEISIGTRYVWVEYGHLSKGIVVDINGNKKQYIIIQWFDFDNSPQYVYEVGNIKGESVTINYEKKSQLIKYPMHVFQNDTRIQIDKEYYRDIKLKELGI